MDHTAPAPVSDPNKNLWHAVLAHQDYAIVQALQAGADPAAGPSEQVRQNYKERKLTEDLLPLCGLLRQRDRLHRSFDQHHMDFKESCKTLIKATHKKHFGVRGGTTPLIEYAQLDTRAQRKEIFDMVLRRTPKDAINARNELGFSALDYALIAGSLQSVKALLLAGADPDACNQHGQNALWREGKLNEEAIKRDKHQTFVRLLVKHGARVRAAHDGTHLLHFNHSTPLASLEELHVDLNAPHPKGRSLVQMAVWANAWGRLKELMELPGIDWQRQVPDVDEISNRRRQISSLDTTGQDTLSRLEVFCQQAQLDAATQSPTTGRARARF